MFLWRSAWQSLAPLARSSALPLSRNVVPLRHMSSSVPGSSGGNFMYFALVGVSLSAGVLYAYKTLSTDHARFKDRLTEIGTRPKEEWKPKPWPPKDDSAALIPDLLGAVKMVAAAAPAAETVKVVVASVEEIPQAAVEPPEKTVTVTTEESKESSAEAPDQGATGEESDVRAELAETNGSLATVEVEEPVVTQEMPLVTDETLAEEQVSSVVKPEIVTTTEEPAGIMKTEPTVLVEGGSTGAIATEEPVAGVEEESAGLTIIEEPTSAVEQLEVITAIAEPVAAVDEESEVITSTEEPAAAVDEEPEVISATEEPRVVVAEPLEVITATVEPAVAEEEEPDMIIATVEPATAVEEQPEVITADEPGAAVEEQSAGATAAEEATFAIEDDSDAAPATKDTEASLEENIDMTTGLLAVTSVNTAVADPKLDILKTMQTGTSETSVDILMEVPEVEAEASPVETEVAPAMDPELSSAIEPEPLVEGAVSATMEISPEALQDTNIPTESQVMETPTAEPKQAPMREYIVVVLEGVPKVPKTPKVLAIAPVRGNIPPPDEDNLPAARAGKQEASAGSM